MPDPRSGLSARRRAGVRPLATSARAHARAPLALALRPCSRSARARAPLALALALRRPPAHSPLTRVPRASLLSIADTDAYPALIAQPRTCIRRGRSGPTARCRHAWRRRFCDGSSPVALRDEVVLRRRGWLCAGRRGALGLARRGGDAACQARGAVAGGAARGWPRLGQITMSRP